MPEASLFTPLTFRGLTLRNRVAMSPMCQYVAEDGFADDWHFVHLGSRAVGGVGLVMVEATAVTPDGRITPNCLGIWDDKHIDPLARIVRFVRKQGARIGIQLAHAGRKASTNVPWKSRQPLTPDQGGWPVVGPSPIAFDEKSPVPRPLDQQGIEAILAAFVAAAQRALRAGFELIELHAAHGYLFHSFLSPFSNQRTDEYGGSLENRLRFLQMAARRVREALPDEMPLFARISATDWVEGGWDLPQSIELARRLRSVGVDLIDCSSGGAVPHAVIPTNKCYQVPFARAIRHEAGIATGAVGLITEPAEADGIIRRGDADLVSLARALLREPYWTYRAQQELHAELTVPNSYARAFK